MMTVANLYFTAPQENDDGWSISHDMFGDIYTTFTTLANYMQESSSYCQGAIRWPGGSLAEAKTSATIEYNLLNSDVYENNANLSHGRGLSDLLTLANDRGVDFSMIIPTLSTFDLGIGRGGGFRENLLSNYIQTLDIFVDRLTAIDGYFDIASEYLGRGNTIVLEIGNETSHMGWANGTYNSSWNYGVIAASTLEYAAENSEILENNNIEIYIQAGVNVGGAFQIITEVTEWQASSGLNLFDEIDGVVSHNALVFQAEDFNFNAEQAIINLWSRAITENSSSNNTLEDVTFYASAWSVGDHRFGGSIFDENLSLQSRSDFRSDRSYNEYLEYLSDLDGNDVGARQGAGTVDVLAKLIALGYEAAALWGTVDPSLHTNSYQSAWLSENWNRATGESASNLSHGGEVLRALSECLPDLALQLGGVLTTDQNGNLAWGATYFDEASRNGSGEVNNYIFGGERRHVIVSTATDIDGFLATATGELTQTYDISNFGEYNTVNVEVIGTEFLQSEWREFRNNPENQEYLSRLNNNELLEFRRLFEIPNIQTYSIEVGEDGIFEHTFTSDFETVIFTFEEEPINPKVSSMHVEYNPDGSISTTIHCFDSIPMANVMRNTEINELDSQSFDEIVFRKKYQDSDTLQSFTDPHSVNGGNISPLYPSDLIMAGQIANLETYLTSSCSEDALDKYCDTFINTGAIDEFYSTNYCEMFT